MINPLKSEEEAFRLTILIALLAAPVALAALLFGAGVALGVAAGLLFAGALLWIGRRRQDEQPQRVDLGEPIADQRRRILVVANETLAGRALLDEITYRARNAESAELFVVCPALNSKIRHWTNEEGEARAQARERLAQTLASLNDAGFRVDGDIGDDDPVQAAEDALRLFRADEAIVSTHPPGKSNWLEAEVVARARERFDIPITHVVVDLEREPGLAAERI